MMQMRCMGVSRKRGWGRTWPLYVPKRSHKKLPRILAMQQDEGSSFVLNISMKWVRV